MLIIHVEVCQCKSWFKNLRIQICTNIIIQIGATINCPEDFNCNIRCESHYSCANATINYPTGADAEGSLTCTGSYSCDSMDFPTPNPNIPYNITCEGHEACRS